MTAAARKREAETELADERRVLARKMKTLTKEEREEAYERFGVRVDGTKRKRTLAQRLWVQWDNPTARRVSSELILRLNGYDSKQIMDEVRAVGGFRVSVLCFVFDPKP